MKKKSQIHIKPSHEGRFTEWCQRHGYSGVNSTSIAAGKRSKDPKVRRMATFADNAHHWN